MQGTTHCSEGEVRSNNENNAIMQVYQFQAKQEDGIVHLV